MLKIILKKELTIDLKSAKEKTISLAYFLDIFIIFLVYSCCIPEII